MADSKKLRIPITADTSDFKKGMREASKSLNDFKKDGEGAISGVASAFGLSSGAIGDVINNLKQATSAFKLMGSAGEGASAAATKGMKALTASIAGLGIMAAVAAFKELNSEVSNFEQRMQGVNLAAGAKAYRDTYRQALYDSSGAGEEAARAFENIRTGISKSWTNVMTGIFGWDAGDRRDAEQKAERAAELAREMVDLKRAQRDVSVEIQAIDNQIADAQSRFRNNQLDANERKAAEAEITDLINQKYDKQEYIQKRITANIKERNSLTKSTEAELDEEAEAERALLSLDGQRQREKNALLRTSNSIATAMGKQAASAKETNEATVLTLEAARQLVEQQRALKAIQDQNNAIMSAARFRMDGPLQAVGSSGALQGMAERLTVPAIIKPIVDTEAAQKAVVELSSVLEQGVVGMSEALGNLIGNLINGENAWQGFAQAGIGVVADMLSTVGKAFVTEGVGVIAAQMALKTGNGPAAIAAGAAMIALAATMKTAMSNAAANWSGGSGAAVASSSYSSGTTGPSTYGREMTIRVTGTLTGEGSKLKAVINNDDRRNNVTT